MLKENKNKRSFLEGPVWKRIVAQAIPLTIAQLVHLLYNVVDRIYLGHMGEENSLALTGVGLTFPIITLIMAFTALFGNGGVPLFSIARGKGDDKEAEKIMNNSFSLLILSSAILMLVSYIFMEPVLYLFGAGKDSIVYAKEYLYIYLIGTLFSMITTGLNGYINAQGFPKFGMITTVLGAVANIILDALFILGFNMGVSGAALATVISQTISALWVLNFLTSRKAELRLNIKRISLNISIIKNILKLGTSNFIMQGTNCLVQIACNSTLQLQGGAALGDTYVAI
ncbi:MAG: polysaccharide biosynthesis C-terminal domain-containing protein, partial [Clostridia bacterium]|nr:polysaccharide biosynthesis C-terminal domain-containing protein [Clostridia bacterium]